MKDQGSQPQRETIASELLSKTNKTAALANEVVEKLNAKLRPIMIDINPGGVSSESRKEERELPPLFNEWNLLICSIRNNLESIIDIMERAEI